MILFDYIFYFFSNLYKLSKSERAHGGFKDSGCMAVGGTIPLFIMPILLLIDDHYGTNYLNLETITVLFLITFPFFIIRYNKFTSYEEVKAKVKSLNKTSILFLDIFLIIYLFIVIGGIIYMIYRGATKA